MAPGTSIPKSPSPLPPFAHTWVGGDIHGLSALAGTLFGYVPKVSDVVSALDKQVARVVSDAGWQGKAAAAFSGNWEKVSAQTNAVGVLITETAGIVDQLAVNLARAENALEQAAAKAAAHGVQAGANGQPPAVCYASKTQEDWRLGYQTFYQQCMQAAQNARIQAAGDLQALSAAITKAKSAASADLGTKIGEGTTVADYLGDLLATPTAYSHIAAGLVADATKKLADAKSAWLAAQAAARQANGRFGVMPADVKQALAGAKAELASAPDVAAAQSSETWYSKILGARVRDVPGVGNLADPIDSGLFAKALDLPVVDVVAGGVTTVLNAQQDMSKGVPGWAAYPLETGGTAASIAAGTVAGGAIAGLVGGASIAGAPVLGVAAGAAVGGVVVYGVGDYIHNYIADFGQEWHQHGAMGILYDFGAAGASTWSDTTQLAGDVGHAASSVWHGITSLF